MNLYIFDLHEEYATGCYAVVAESVEEALDLIMTAPKGTAGWPLKPWNDEFLKEPIQDLYRGTWDDYLTWREQFKKTIVCFDGKEIHDYPNQPCTSWVLHSVITVHEDEDKGVRYYNHHTG